MAESKAQWQRERKQAIDEIHKADYLANVYYPQMFGPKIMGLSATFLELFLKGKMTFTEFESYNVAKSRNKTQELRESTDRLHKHYGRTNPVAVRDIKRTFSTTQNWVRYCLTSLFETMKLKQFLDNPENRSKIESASLLLNTSLTELYTPEMKKECEEYRNTFTPVLTLGIDRLDDEEKSRLRSQWSRFSSKVEQVITFSAENENSRLDTPFTDEQLQRFLSIVAKDGSHVVTQDRF